MIYIYSLTDPRDGMVKYIGKSKNPEKRLKAHGLDSDSPDKYLWFLELKRENSCPTLDIIDTCDKEGSNFMENFYISLFVTWGFDLYNRVGNNQKNHFARTTNEKKIAIIRQKNLKRYLKDFFFRSNDREAYKIGISLKNYESLLNNDDLLNDRALNQIDEFIKSHNPISERVEGLDIDNIIDHYDEIIQSAKHQVKTLKKLRS